MVEVEVSNTGVCIHRLFRRRSYRYCVGGGKIGNDGFFWKGGGKGRKVKAVK